MLQDFSLDYFSLKGKVAMVTGGNTGLGMAYCVAFAKAGADVYIPHFTDDISEVKSLIEETGQQVRFLQGNLTDPEYREAFVQDCLKEYGHIDILVNNAGIASVQDFWTLPEEVWRNVVELNFNVTFFLSQRVAEVMKEQRSGKIINIGSSMCFQADGGNPAYAPTKAGILGITRMLCQELARYNIQVNTFCPGRIASDKPDRALQMKNKARVEYISNGIPAGYEGDTADMMGSIVYLASRASDYLNGESLHVDGGKCTTFSPPVSGWPQV